MLMIENDLDLISLTSTQKKKDEAGNYVILSDVLIFSLSLYFLLDLGWVLLADYDSLNYF